MAQHPASTSGPGHLDAIGAWASFACAAHCLLLPLALTLLPLAGLQLLADHTFEALVLLFAVGLAVVSLCWGRRVHGDSRVFWFLGVGIACFLTAHQLMEGEIGHAVFMAAGGVSLALGHVLNRRLCKSCRSCC